MGRRITVTGKAFRTAILLCLKEGRASAKEIGQRLGALPPGGVSQLRTMLCGLVHKGAVRRIDIEGAGKNQPRVLYELSAQEQAAA